MNKANAKKLQIVKQNFSKKNTTTSQTVQRVNYYSDLYKEVYNNTYITAGKKNDHYIFLDSLLQLSSIHRQCVDVKTNYICGHGFNSNDSDINYTNFCKNSHDKNDLTDIINAITHNLVVNNGFALKIFLSNDIENKKISRISFLSIKNIRFVDYDKNTIVYSDDIINPSAPSYTAPLFNYDLTQDFSVLYFDATQDNPFVYPVPDYAASLQYIQLDELIQAFHHNNAKNGWHTGHVLYLPGLNNLTDDMIDAAYTKLQENFEGAKSERGVMIVPAESEATKAKLEAIPSNSNDEKFLTLLDKLEGRLLAAHAVNPALLGINVAGNSIITNGDELLNIAALFKATYVKQRQLMIENVINSLLALNQIQTKFKLNEFVLNLPKPISTTNIINIISNAALTFEQKQILLRLEGVSDTDIELMLTKPQQ